MNGKGDRPRPVDQAKWEENYDRIFRRPGRKVATASLKASGTRTGTSGVNLPRGATPDRS